jgi:hypothetical protein
MKQFNLREWVFRYGYDPKGWWIEDSKGYRTKLSLAYTTAYDKNSALEVRRVVIKNCILEWCNVK